MKRHIVTTLLALALGLSAAIPVSADGTLASDQIVKSLTKLPLKVQDKDGKWIQPDPTLDLQVQFELDRATLTALGAQQLDQLALAIQNPALAQARFELAGHTDATGSYDHNMKLSTDRAIAVRDYLNHRYGIALDRLVTQGYGFTRLADPANPTSGINRRVEIRHLLAVAYGNGIAPQPIAPQTGTVAPLPPNYIAPASGGQLVPRP